MSEAKYLRPERVSLAIRTLSEWRQSAKSQPAKHLWPLLALVRTGVGKSAFKGYKELLDFDFWNDYFRLPGDTRSDKDSEGKFTDDYYVDPLVLSLKPSDHPHRGPWTIRVRTFLNSWRAATAEGDNSRWRLAPNYADIFVKNVLTRDSEIHKIPVVDLAAFLFRDIHFSADADAKALETTFRNVFPFDAADYQKLFRFEAEKPESLFQSEKPSAAALREEMLSVLVPKSPTPPAPPAVIPTGFKSLVDDDDPILLRVKELLEANSSGIIFRGCPGTSKTWYAKQIAHKLVDDPKHIFHCQFHPSLGYEDFVEGHVPDETTRSGFRVTNKIFLEACDAASRVTSNVAFIIDEINRGDPARVFGELLTYIEHGYRGVPFRKAYSGKEAVVPKNLIVFGTMNQHDRSITQFDLALIRRFDHVNVEPDVEFVEKFLSDTKKFSPDQIERVARWFEALQRLLPFGIGHTYFKDVLRPESLRVVWRHRMAPYCEAVLELDQGKLADVKKSFDGMFAAVTGHGTET